MKKNVPDATWVLDYKKNADVKSAYSNSLLMMIKMRTRLVIILWAALVTVN